MRNDLLMSGLGYSLDQVRRKLDPTKLFNCPVQRHADLHRRILFSFVALSIQATSFAVEGDQDNFAISQYDNGYGVKTLVIQGYKHANCKRLIEIFERSLRRDCPDCRREYAKCTNSIEPYGSVWLNKVYHLPYVSSGAHRYVYSGLSRAKADALCVETAERAKSIGRSALCIRR